MPDRSSTRTRHVTAVIVAHDGHTWLPTLLSALQLSHRAPDDLIAIDTGSADGTRDDLVRALGDAAVHNAARGTGFGTAVAQALDSAPRAVDEAVEWVWLLHDDCAPEPDALDFLLERADADPSIAIVGPKLRGWPQSRRLKEVGITISGAGRRDIGFEGTERDQGQRDDIDWALAVSTAGMLIRRDVYDAVGGFDPALPLHFDDIDLGWRVAALGYRTVLAPRAVVHHVDAATEGRRPVHASGKRRRRLQRGSGMYVLLVNASKKRLPLLWIRLVVGSLLRVVGLLLGKAPRAAWQELRALVDTVSGLRGLHRGRAQRAKVTRAGRTRDPERPAGDPRSLMAPYGAQVRRLIDAFAEVVGTAGSGGSVAAGGGRHRVAIESGPGTDDTDDLVMPESVRWRRLFQPVPLTLLGLAVVTAIACRALFGGGLSGGVLLPVEGGLDSLWREYLSGWHAVEMGSTGTAPGWLAVLAGMTTLAGGSPDVAIGILLIAAVPLSGLTAALAARTVIEGRLARCWATAAYALLPAASGAVAQGRFTTCLVLVLLPLLLMAVRRAMTGGFFLRGSWPATFTAGLLLGVVCACEPAVGGLFALGGIAGATLARSLQWLLRSLVIVATAAAVNLPWLPALLRQPSLAWGQAGLDGPGAATGTWPWWLHPLTDSSIWQIAIPVLAVGALAGTLRRDRGRPVLVGWLVVLLAGGFAVVQRSVLVPLPGGGSGPAWPGTMLAVLLAAFVAIAAIGADGAPERLRAQPFGWRQLASLVVAVPCGLLPLTGAAWWVIRGADGPVQAGRPDQLPAYIAAEQRTPAGARTLLLTPQPGGGVGYRLLRHPNWSMIDQVLAPDAEKRQALGETVTALLAGREDSSVVLLARLGVRYVYLTPAGETLPPVLDAVDGLARGSAPTGDAVWRVDDPVGPMRLLSTSDPIVIAQDPRSAVFPLADGRGRILQVAEAADPGWRVTATNGSVAGVDIDPIVLIKVPDGPGTVTVSYRDDERRLLLWLQLAAVVVGLVLAFPGLARAAEADASMRVRDTGAEPGWRAR